MEFVYSTFMWHCSIKISPIVEIPLCYLLYEFGSLVNPSAFDHRLGPTFDCFFGNPLPRRLTNQMQAPPWVGENLSII